MVIILSRMRAFATWSSVSYPLYVNCITSLTSTCVQPEPTTADVLWMVINLAAGVPVWLCVGIFSLYHLYIAAGNSTTIEGWEKDRVATLVRRGKIKEVSYPVVQHKAFLTCRIASSDQIPICQCDLHPAS